MTTHQTHCRGRQAGAATTGVARCGQVQVGRHRVQAGRWMQGRIQGQAGVCRLADMNTERCGHRAGGHRHGQVANVSTRIK